MVTRYKVLYNLGLKFDVYIYIPFISQRVCDEFAAEVCA
jgi:hypothetical protein